jgi:hypothetical protein
MRSNSLMNLKANMNSLNLSMPTDIEKYESIIEKIAAVPKHTGRRGLEGVTPKTVGEELERRALDAVLAKERANQARLMTDSAHANIDRALINATEDIIDDLRPIVLEAHRTIMDAHEKMNGNIDAETAIALDASKQYKAANDAWATIDTAATIRSTLYALDYPDFERSAERRLTLYRFHSLQAWRAYEALPDAGSGAANHALSATTDGVEPAWLSTDDAEAQSHALGKAQSAEARGDDAGMVFDKESMVYRVGSKAWMHL